MSDWVVGPFPVIKVLGFTNHLEQDNFYFKLFLVLEDSLGNGLSCRPRQLPPRVPFLQIAFVASRNIGANEMLILRRHGALRSWTLSVTCTSLSSRLRCAEDLGAN